MVSAKVYRNGAWSLKAGSRGYARAAAVKRARDAYKWRSMKSRPRIRKTSYYLTPYQKSVVAARRAARARRRYRSGVASRSA